MAGPAFYSQEDQDIYENNPFMPQSKYLLNAPTFNTPNVEEVITESGIPATDAFQNSGGGGGGGGNLGGDFGNLDLSNTKTFTKNVWDGTDWVSKEVTGYMNPTLGNWQTKQGKNINHGGLNVPSIAGMLFDKNYGKGPQIGDIEGTFTHGWDSGKGKIKEGWEEEKDKWAGITGINKMKSFFKNKKEQKLQDEILAHNVAAADEIGATGPQWHTSKGGQDQPGAGGQNVKSSSGDTYGGEAAGYNEAAEKSDYYAKGGRIGYFFGGRTGFAEGGWTPGAGRDESGYQSDHGSYSGGDNNNGGGGGGKKISNFIDTSNLTSMSPEVSANYSPAEWMAIKGRLFNTGLTDNDNIETEANISGDLGNFNYDINLDQEGNKNYNLGYENNIKGYDVAANTDLNNTNFSVGKNGYNFTGSTGEDGNNIGLSKTWSFGQEPQQTVNRRTLKQENPDLIYGQMRNGGLAGLL